MPHHLRFTKVTGAGNDFVLIDNRDRALRVDPSALARLLCSRNFGVGADGILLVLPSTVADFTMGYWNADGTTGGMCGNGGRCIAHYAYDRGIAGKEMRFEAFGYVYRAVITPEGVRLRMKPAGDIRQGIHLAREGQVFVADYVNLGVPHAVLFVNDQQPNALASLDVPGMGRWVRNHQEFSPLGTNANFVRAIDQDSIEVRTYERGVEAETLACGTGSVASAFFHRIRSGGSGPVTILARSGIRLKVHLQGAGTDEITAPELEGPAYNVFDGNAFLDDDTTRLWVSGETIAGRSH
jgi:diaminopimelate epimerase